jgi:diguanylate cyclase (GGDEF)-like protein
MTARENDSPVTSRILVVDDEVGLERLIKQRFRKKIQAQEFDFVFVHNGAEAIAHLREKNQIDIVLTDISMPEMDGLTLLNLLPEISQTLKAVVVSAYSDLRNIRTAMNRGAFDFLTKPIDFQDLEITLKKTLRYVQKIKETQQQLEKAQSKLEYQAFHDSLTDLPNRDWFINLLEHNIKLAQRYPEYLYAVLFIDLDRFKVINDSLGHSYGDELLKNVAKKLQANLRASDFLARFGGDEFAILLEKIKDIHEVIRVTERIHQEISSPFLLNNYEVCPEASIGITLSTIGYQHPEEVLRDADAAMYRAKAEGKNRYVVFDPIMQASILEHLALEHDLRRGLELKQLCLHYQPIFSLSTGQLTGFEALARWQHPQRGWISPTKFIPLAEETGLISPLGLFVFQEACEQLRRWQGQFPYQLSLSINVNLSAIELKKVDLVQQIEEVLRTTQVDPSHLKLEITESCLWESNGSSVELLENIKALGIELCIDDFGVGYSSLSRLHEFPLDTLKIDRSFLKRTENPNNWETVKLIIALAHSLEMTVVAEGIETSSQLEELKALNCEFGQGYLFSRPVEHQKASQFLEWEMGNGENRLFPI